MTTDTAYIGAHTTEIACFAGVTKCDFATTGNVLSQPVTINITRCNSISATFSGVVPHEYTIFAPALSIPAPALTVNPVACASEVTVSLEDLSGSLPAGFAGDPSSGYSY